MEIINHDLVKLAINGPILQVVWVIWVLLLLIIAVA